MIAAGFAPGSDPIVILGLAFKENVADLRNSKVADIVRELRAIGAQVAIHDPVVDPLEAVEEYGITLTPWESLPKAAALILAVGHQEYVEMPFDRISEKLVPNGVFIDVKSKFDPRLVTAAGHRVWRL